MSVQPLANCADLDAVEFSALMRRYSSAPGEGDAYRSLAAFLRDAVDTGQLLVGTRLPSERVLCGWVGVSRTTVRAAYRALEEAGYAETRPNVGTVLVASVGATKEAAATFRRAFARRPAPISGNFLLDLMRSSDQFRRYGFDAGMADPELFPLHEFQLVLQELLATRTRDALGYGLTEGQLALRERVVDYLARYRRITGIGPENVLITTGSMQALNLIADAFVEPGDAVALEEPTFPGAILIFANARAELIPIRIDRHGMDVAALAKVLGTSRGARCKLVYIQPTLQNPTGVSMSQERREMLRDTCLRNRCIVVEDDAYGVLDAAPESAALFAARGDTPVIYVGTFSKLISPGLRIGFIVSDVGVIRQLTLLKQVADLHSSGMSQLLIEGWLAMGDVDSYVQKCRTVYARRLGEALRDPFFGDVAEVPLMPHGGFYVFGRFTGDRSSKSIRDIAQAADVSFALGEHFTVTAGLQSSFRLSVSALLEGSTHIGLLRLRQALRRAPKSIASDSAWVPETTDGLRGTNHERSSRC